MVDDRSRTVVKLVGQTQADKDHPELMDEQHPDYPDDLPLSDAERAAADQLSAEQIASIDATLLSHAAANWRKVARLVAATWEHCQTEALAVPPAYILERVTVLVADGGLEAQGNLRRMRFSEVRLPETR